MKLTKYQHACFVVEHDGHSIVIDPGGWSDDFVMPSNVAGIVLTHEHGDHTDTTRLQEIADANPDSIILTNTEVATQLSDMDVQAVTAGDKHQLEGFELEFFGGQHAQIAPQIPTIANIGVLINNSLYYPGDSFVLPEKPVNTLALPVSAPWMKFSEASDFLRTVKPSRVFPTHDAILSEKGKDLADRMYGAVANEIGARYERLSRDSVEI